MLGKSESEPIVIPELDVAYSQANAEKCYRLLGGIADGTIIKSRGLLLMLTMSLEEERRLMGQSISAKKEVGLVVAPGIREVIYGSTSALDLDEVAGAIYKVKPNDTQFLFTHMHWDSTVNPLPSYDVIGIGDIGIWRFLRSIYPNLECRIAFNTRNSVRAIRYLGDAQR